MKDHHVSLRNSGIAVLAPVCMVFIQDGTSAIVQILCKDNRDIGTLVSLLSYIRRKRYQCTDISVVLYNSHYPGIMSVYIQPMDIYNI